MKVHGGKLGDTYFEPAADELQGRLAGAQRGLLRAALGRAGLHPRARRAQRLGELRRRLLRGLGDLHPRARLLHRASSEPVRLDVGLRAAVAVLQALGPAALRPGDARRGVRGRVRAPLRPAQARALLRAYALASATQLRLASLYDSTLGLHALRRGLPRAAGRPHEVHLGGPAHPPAGDGPRLRVGGRLRRRRPRRGAPLAPDASRLPPSPTALERDNREALRLVERHRHHGRRVAPVRGGRRRRPGLTWACTSRRSCAARSRCRASVSAAATSRRRAPSPTWSARSATGTRSFASRGLSTAT